MTRNVICNSYVVMLCISICIPTLVMLNTSLASSRSMQGEIIQMNLMVRSEGHFTQSTGWHWTVDNLTRWLSCCPWNSCFSGFSFVQEFCIPINFGIHFIHTVSNAIMNSQVRNFTLNQLCCRSSAQSRVQFKQEQSFFLF